MKKILSFTLMLVVMIIASVGQIEASEQNQTLQRGTVIYDGAIYHIVQVNDKYAVVKKCSGPTFSAGDVLIGDITNAPYNYVYVYAGNNSSQTMIFVEYYYTNISSCYTWLQTYDQHVYVCTGSSATKYHSNRNCNGLCKCSKEIKKIPTIEAERMGRTKCSICY